MNREANRVDLYLLDYIFVLVHARHMILRNLLVTLVAVLALSFVLPKKYTATASLMPPQEQDPLSMSRMLAEVPIPGLQASPKLSSADLMIEMLNSRSVNERVLARKFGCGGDTLPLYRCLGFSSLESGLLKMPQKTSFMLSKKGITVISVELSNAALSAAVANAYVEELDQVNQEKAVSRARNSRLYIESQLRETESKLAHAMQRLADFQSENQAMALDEQTRSAIQQAGELKGQIYARDVQLGIMLQGMTRANPQVMQVQRELEQLRRKYRELQLGSSAADQGDLYVPFSQVPELGVQSADLLREVKAQETVWELLNQQYYQAKIEEARDIPTVQVLDVAVPPTFRSAPKRKTLLVVFGLLSIVVSVFWAFGESYYRSLDAQSVQKQRLQQLAGIFRRDFEKLKTLRRRR